MGKSLVQSKSMLKFLKENWKYWDDKSMIIRKSHNDRYDGYHCYHIYVAVKDTLLTCTFSQNSDKVLEDLKQIENNRIFKIERIIKDQL